MTEEEIRPVPKISIIVPVYNVEKYLRRCIDSILAQTFTDFELILVDDGSPDGSPAICDEYAEKDGRVRVIHQANAGVSAARNAGLDVARGEWITFVDSDDWVERDFLFEQFFDATSGNFETVVCGLFGRGKPRRIELNREAAKRNILKQGGFGGFSFLRLIRRRNVGTLRFDETISYMEDVLFFWKFFDGCNAILWTDKPLYHYERNEQSVTSAYGLTWQAKSAVNLLDRLYQNEADKKMRRVIFHNRCHFLLSIFVQYIKKHDFDSAEYAYLYREVKKNAFPIMFNVRHNAKRKIMAFLIRFTPLLKPSHCEDKK